MLASTKSGCTEICCRIFWIVLMLLAFGMFCFLIIETTSKLAADTIVLELSKEEIPINSIHFPAVTICPQMFHEAYMPHFDRKYYTESDDK